MKCMICGSKKIKGECQYEPTILHRSPRLSQAQLNRINEIVRNLQQENKQLKDNWNKLKKYIKTEIPEDVFIDTEWFVSILDKMQELEQGSGINE